MRDSYRAGAAVPSVEPASPDLRLVGNARVDLTALPRHRYWSLSSDGETGYWTQLDAEEVVGPYGCVQHAVDELAERAARPVPFPPDCPPREDRGPEANERGLQVALWLCAGMLVIAAIAWAVLR